MDRLKVEIKLLEIGFLKQDLAREMNVTPSTLWRNLTGKTKRPKKMFFIALDVALKQLEYKSDRIRKIAPNVNTKRHPLGRI